MSALGQKQTFAVQKRMSAYPSKADIRSDTASCDQRAPNPRAAHFCLEWRVVTAGNVGPCPRQTRWCQSLRRWVGVGSLDHSYSDRPLRFVPAWPCLRCNCRANLCENFRSSLVVRKWSKTNTRISDERLSLSRLPPAILSINAEFVKFSLRAISCNPSQNLFSRDTLVLAPLSTTERLTMSVATKLSPCG